MLQIKYDERRNIKTDGFMKCLSVVLLITSALSTSLKAEDLYYQIQQLGQEDFDVREEYTEKLSKLNTEFIKIFLRLADTYYEDNPEICIRLKVVAKNIYRNEMIKSDDKIQKLLGSIGIDYESHCFYYNRLLMEDYDGGFNINYVDEEGPCADLLKSSDIILEINKVKAYRYIGFAEYGLFKEGFEYDLTILRPIDYEKLSWRRDFQEFVDYKIFRVHVKGIKKYDKFIDWERINDEVNTLWTTFCNNFMLYRD